MSATNYLVENSAINKITFGSTYIANSSNQTSYNELIKIDATHFIIIYSDITDSNKLNSVIGTIDGAGAITYGSEYYVGEINSSIISGGLLDSTHFVIAWRNLTTNLGKAAVGTISGGNIITYGAIYTFNNESTALSNLIVIDSTHFIVNYKDIDNSNKGTSIVGTVSSVDHIAFGSKYLFNNASTGFLFSALIDSTHYVVSFQDASDSNKGKSIIGTIDGAYAITFGSKYTFSSNDCSSYMPITLIDSTHFIIIYNEDVNLLSYCIIGTISSVDHIAFGSPYLFISYIIYPNIALIDSTHFIIQYQAIGNNNIGRTAIGTINSGVITYSNFNNFNGTNVLKSISESHGIAILNSTNFLMVFSDNTDTNKLKAIIETISHTFDLDYLLEPIKAGFTQTITNSGYKVGGVDIVNNYMRNDCTNQGTTLSTLIAAGRTLNTTNYKKLAKDIDGKDGLEIFTIVPKGYAAGTISRIEYTPGTYNEIFCNGRLVVNAIVIGGGGVASNGAGNEGGGGGGAGGIIAAQLEWPNYGNINLSIIVGAAQNNSVLSYIYNSTTYYIKGLTGANASGVTGGLSGLTSRSYNSAIATIINYSENTDNTLGKGGDGGLGSSSGYNGTSNTTDIHLYKLIGVGTENGGIGAQFISYQTVAQGYGVNNLTAIAGGIGGAGYNSGYPLYTTDGGGGGGGGGQSNVTPSTAGHGSTTVTAGTGVGVGGGGGRNGSGGEAGTNGSGGQVVLFY